MADKLGLKYKNCQFGQNPRLWETDVLRIRYQYRYIPKQTFNVVCHDNSHHLLNYILAFYVNFSVNGLKFAPK